MVSDQEALIRNKITGVLVRIARLRAGRDLDECAAALSCDTDFIERAEEGREALTLPQLESLARVLDVPVQYLLGEQELPAAQAEPDPEYYATLMLIRRKIMGVILQQARIEAGRTVDDVASAVGWEPDRLNQVEWGQAPIALVELLTLAEELGIPLDQFLDPDKPATPQAKPPEMPAGELQQLSHLTAELQEFVAQPINVPYLQTAMNLSQVPADILRQIASGLFEITY
jgi:transcriptional regulator with XRE-family HTH domain